MAGLLAGLGLVLVGAGLLWLAWRGSQHHLRPEGAFEAAAGPLGLGGGVIATCGVGVLAVGLDVIGVTLSVIALVALVVSTVVAAVVGRRAARDAGGSAAPGLR